MSFLTVEDVNSTLIKYRDINIFHTINTRNISLDEFENVKYDFCNISHSISGENHTFEFIIVNSNWTGAYYFTNENGDYLDVDATFITNTNTIQLTTSEASVRLVLYCTSLANEFNFVRMTWRPISLESIETSVTEIKRQNIPVLSLNNENLAGKIFTMHYSDRDNGYGVGTNEEFGLNDNNEYTIPQTGNPNSDRTSVSYNGVTFYYDIFIKKLIPDVEITGNVTVGKINKVELTVPNVFTESNGFIPMIQFPYLKGYVYYGDETIPLKFDANNNKYYFDLDLREKTDNNHVKLSLEILETDYIQNNVYNFNIRSKYLAIDNVSDLIKEMGVNGSKIIELANDFNLVGDITVSHDMIIYGKDHSLNLNEHSFILTDGITLKINKLSFNNGDNAIIQNENTKLELTDCTFYNCKSRDYNNIGSCIFCDVNLESLSIDDDFTTNLSNCTFINNHSAILHGGQIIVDNCKFRNTNLDVVDMNNPAFLYQVDGDATISNSIFDIDYSDSDDLCVNNENIGFAQVLFMCGQSASINKVTYSILQADNSLPFFEAPYNNKSHLFVKYYYPQIDSCVFASPVLNYEDKSCCHAVSGVDWIFKDNIQITRADWETENNIKKINWED